MLDKSNLLHNYWYAKEILVLSVILIGIGLNFTMGIGLFLIIMVLIFFRNNLNLKEMKDEDIISPSSSEVMDIKIEGDKTKISTYLAPIDRHYMIAPVDCRVKKIERRLLKGDAERVIIHFEDMKGNDFMLSPIVKKLFNGPGLLGSWVLKLMYNERIVYFCKEGDILKRGERWGLIRFGSAMDYEFPNSYNIRMEKGDKYSLADIIGNEKGNNVKKEEREEMLSDLIEKVPLNYWLVGSIAPIIVFFYGWYRCSHIKEHKDILEFSLIKNSKKYGVDGWLLSHYLFFVMMGFIYPNTLRISVIMGLVWELFEWYCGVYKPKCLEGIGFCKSPSGAKQRGKVWWYWKWQDPIANTLGFITGKYIRVGRVLS